MHTIKKSSSTEGEMRTKKKVWFSKTNIFVMLVPYGVCGFTSGPRRHLHVPKMKHSIYWMTISGSMLQRKKRLGNPNNKTVETTKEWHVGNKNIPQVGWVLLKPKINVSMRRWRAWCDLNIHITPSPDKPRRCAKYGKKKHTIRLYLMHPSLIMCHTCARIESPNVCRACAKE